jgi:broad specificity phosphatase PhoE
MRVPPQRFLHGDVAHRSADLATRLCKDVLPNCSVACCQLDFTRGPRMITDVRLLVTSPSPSGGMKLVMQRQFEQFAGPVVHLVSVNNVPLCEPAGARVTVSMWLADSSGVHIGRHALWPASTPAPASDADARAVAEAKRNRSRRAQSVPWRGRCTWNSAHQLGQSHWGADSILHIAVRSAKTSSLLASAELPMRCVPPEGIELGALSAARHGPGKPGLVSSDDPLRPCTVTLRCVPTDRGSAVKHLFLLHTAESSWSDAYRTMLRAAGLSDPRGALAGGSHEAPAEQGLPKLKQRLGRIVDRGQEAYQRLRAVMARTDHPISRNGYEQARRLRNAIEASAAAGVAEPPAGGPDGAPPADAQREAILSVLHGTRAVWSSPATRAVQTAQLATLPLLPAGQAIELKANARQRRGLTNPNTSIGVASGDAIHARCVETLRELASAADGEADEAVLSKVEARPLDTHEVASVWWSDKAEPERDFQARLAELVAQIRHSPHDSIILCAHDDIFHELLGRYTNPSARGRHAALLEQLAAGSVPPCALIWCCLDFGREHPQPINDIRDVGELLPQLPDVPVEPGLERVGTSPG